MSFATWNFLNVYARWRDAFLRAYPQKRLFPEPDEDSEAPDRGFISIGSEGKKIGGLVALVIVFLVLAESRNSK